MTDSPGLPFDIGFPGKSASVIGSVPSRKQVINNALAVSYRKRGLGSSTRCPLVLIGCSWVHFRSRYKAFAGTGAKRYAFASRSGILHDMEQPFIRRHFRKVIIGLALVLVAALWVFFGPAKTALKSWRASGLIVEAQEHAEANEWEEVYRTALASLQNKESLEALRLLTKAAVKTGDPRTLEMAYTLFRYPGASPEDRGWVLSLAFDSGDLINATRLASLLSPEDTSHPAVHYQLVRGYLLSGKYQEAIALADDPSMKSRDPALDLLLADRLAGSGLEGAREATTARLETVLNSEDRDLALRAMNQLALLKDQWISEPLAQVSLDRFQDDPDLGAGDKLNLELFRIGLKQRPLEEVVDQAITDYQEKGLPVLVRWLARLAQHQKIVDLTEGGEIGGSEIVFKLRLHALESLAQWDQLETELKNPGVLVPEPLLLATRALVAARRGDMVQSLQRWQKAIEVAKRDQNRNWFYQLAGTARQLGDMDRLMETVIEGIKHPLGIPPDTKDLAPLFQWLKDRGEGKRLLEVSSLLLRREPDNPLLLNNYSYLKALYGNPEKDEVEAMREIVSRYPGQENFRNTLAFVILSTGDAKASLEVMEQAGTSPADFSNTGKAIYAKALFDLLRKDQALDLAKSINWDEMSKDEQKKLALPAP